MPRDESNQSPEFARWESDLHRLAGRVPGLPMNELLVAHLCVHIGRKVAAMLARETNSHQLSEPQFRILTILFSQSDGAARPSLLQDCSFQSSSNLSRIGEVLEHRGLITREKLLRDKRQTQLRITKAGDDEVRRLLPKTLAAARAVLRSLAIDEQVVLTCRLRRLQETLLEQGRVE
jgi:MarR family transcriptional repressor of emrRAB